METARMGAGRASTLTERDRFWLGHLKRIAGQGIEAKAYAAREKLSAQALYQGKRRLVRLGAWPRGEARSAFPRVRVAREPESRPVALGGAMDPALRLRLPGGGVLEWKAPPPPEWLAELALRLGGGR